jgi:phosphate transport system substrate-binding protein
MASNTVPRLIIKHLVITLLLLAPAPLLAEVRLAGSSAILPVVREAMKVFHEQTGIPISLRGGGSDAGIQGVLEGSANIGMVSRALSNKEREQLQSHLIGYDGIAVIVHSSIPIKAIDKAQISAIYSGKINNWRSLGGRDQQISVIAKEVGRSTRKLFDEHCGLQTITPNAQLAGSNTEAIVLVGSNSNAIGYVSIGAAEEASQLRVSIKALPLNGIPASRDNIINGSYPIRHELNLVTRGEPSDEARLFISFILSEAGQAIIRQQHFVSLNQQAITR